MALSRRTVVIALVALATGAGLVVAAALIYPSAYDGRIVPGVSVRGVPLGGMTAAEATEVLVSSLPAPADQRLALRANPHAWQIAWSDVGQRYDASATAAAALAAGRADGALGRVRAAWRTRLDGQGVDPVLVPAEPALIADVLARAGALIAVAPVEAQLEITPAGVVSRPGQAGVELDVEASAIRLQEALLGGAAEVELVLRPVDPQLASPEPALGLAQALLAEPFTLVASDPPTDYYAEFVAGPERVATWLRAEPEIRDGQARMALVLDRAAVRAWLEEVSGQLGAERMLDVSTSLTYGLEALRAGEHRMEGRIRHPASSYIVQPGDCLFDIAYSFGFPRWRLEQANPDLDPDGLEIGMELVIPSIDVLLPRPVVRGKLIEIDLPAQKLRAYDHGQVTYEFTCSSGMSSTPTIAGQFQVLMKEEVAYAERWELEMPYFIGIYQEGPSFYNGIHELPINAAGSRLWARVLGWPASYGCIILDIGDAQALYDWAPLGTLVRIEGVAPGTPTHSAAPEPEGEPPPEVEAPPAETGSAE